MLNSMPFFFVEHIKAIITSEEVLLRDPLDDNIVPIVEDLQRRVKPVNGNPEVNGDGNDVGMGDEDDSPFKSRALEVALEAICSFLSAHTIELETAAYPALDMLTSKACGVGIWQARRTKILG